VAPLDAQDKSGYASERFAASLQALISEARQEGLRPRDLKQIFTQLLKEMDNVDA
jgi:hypothetical protein